MKIIVDENISFGEEAFSTLGEVSLVNGREITPSIVKEADALIVRSITNVNEELLRGSKVKFVGTATIGTDHIDEIYLRTKGIEFTSATGCNSHAVKEFVFSSLAYISEKEKISLEGKSLGVVGCGNIGSKVARVGKAMGLEVVMNDPPLQRETGSTKYSSLEDAFSCDIITFHVPLNLEGRDKTFHLINSQNINLIKSGAIVINSSRGPVVENAVLKKRLIEKNDLHVALDVWEKEPNIDLELFDKIRIGTPHIAGYSLEGKVNGTVIVYNKLCSFLNVDSMWEPNYPDLDQNKIILQDKSINSFLTSLFENVYSVKEDDKLLRSVFELESKERTKYFDKLRKTYRLRRELNNYYADKKNLSDNLKKVADILRLKSL